MSTPEIKLTDRAREQFLAALSEGGGSYIRISIDDKYRHELGVDDARPEDLPLVVSDVPFLLDPNSLKRANGVSIDFVNRASGPGFKIENPNEPQTHVKTLQTATWNQDVLESAEPILVDFWAAWCGPCRAISPMIEELARDFRGRVRVGKLNVDDHREIAQRYSIQSVPTLIVFRGAQEVERLVGTKPKAQLEALLQKVYGGEA